MSLQVIDYLEGYNHQCVKHNTAPLTYLQQFLAKYIDIGKVPNAFILRGNHTQLRDCRLTDSHLEIVISSFGKNIFLSKLDLSFNCITDKGISVVAKCLKSTDTHLCDLKLSSNNFGSGACIILADALVVNTTLATLDLSNNDLSDDGCMAIAETLQVNTTLKKLYLNHCMLSLPILIAICTVLHPNTSLEVLAISDNYGAAQHNSASLHQDFVRHLSNLCSVNKTLSELYLSKLNFDDNDMVHHFGPALKLANNLKVLDLSCNRIMQDGARAIATNLIAHSSLERLNLSNNIITTPGMNSITEMLIENTVLTELYVNNVGAGTDALQLLAQVLTSSNSSLQVITVWGNEFYTNTRTGMSLKATVVPVEKINACIVLWDTMFQSSRIQPGNTDICFYQVDQRWHVAKNVNFKKTGCIQIIED